MKWQFSLRVDASQKQFDVCMLCRGCVGFEVYRHMYMFYIDCTTQLSDVLKNSINHTCKRNIA